MRSTMRDANQESTHLRPVSKVPVCAQSPSNPLTALLVNLLVEFELRKTEKATAADPMS